MTRLKHLFCWLFGCQMVEVEDYIYECTRCKNRVDANI